MEVTYDPNKNQKNIAKRGLSFDRVHQFDFSTALFQEDDRFDYGEIRVRALGIIDGKLHALVFTETETGIRVISFRKATKHEVKYYESYT